MTSTLTAPSWPGAAQLGLWFDASRLRADLAHVTGHLWDKQRSSLNTGQISAPADRNWRVLPLRNLGGDPARTDPGGVGPVGFAATPHLDRLPYLRRVLETIPAPLNSARLMALGPRTASDLHADTRHALWRGCVRLHVPITTNPDAILVLDGITYRWRPGEVWCGEFARPHMVRNGGDQVRVHLLIDALVTDALLDLFPPETARAVRSGEVLVNPPDQPHTIHPDVRAEIPEGFIDFDTDDHPDPGQAVWARITRDGSRALLRALDRDLLMIHVGGERYRFSGWSCQRTLRLDDGHAVLCTQDRDGVRELRVPLSQDASQEDA